VGILVQSDQQGILERLDQLVHQAAWAHVDQLDKEDPPESAETKDQQALPGHLAHQDPSVELELQDKQAQLAVLVHAVKLVCLVHLDNKANEVM